MSMILHTPSTAITGTATVGTFTGGIVINSFSFGAQLPQQPDGKYSGFPVVQSITVSRATDATSIQIIREMAKQSLAATMEFAVTKAIGTTQLKYWIITLTNAKILGYAGSATSPNNDADAHLQEQFYLQFDTIKFSYAAPNADNTALGTPTDVTLNTVTKVTS
jgi:type VI protein secretion system component Hcp